MYNKYYPLSSVLKNIYLTENQNIKILSRNNLTVDC